MMFNNLDISEIKWTVPDLPEANQDASMINSIYMDFKEHMGYAKSRRSNSAPRNSNGSTERDQIKTEPKPPVDMMSDRSLKRRNFKSWLEEKKAKEHGSNLKTVYESVIDQLKQGNNAKIYK